MRQSWLRAACDAACRLRNIISTDNTSITDVASVEQGVMVPQPVPPARLRLRHVTPPPCQASINLINVFFYFVAAIGITLCFFILLVSFDSSIRQVRPPLQRLPLPPHTCV